MSTEIDSSSAEIEECSSDAESHPNHLDTKITTQNHIYTSSPADKQDDIHFKQYNNSMNRRSSGSKYEMAYASSENVNLADEIKKLSDRLMILTSINAEFVHYDELKKLTPIASNDQNGYKSHETPANNVECAHRRIPIKYESKRCEISRIPFDVKDRVYDRRMSNVDDMDEFQFRLNRSPKNSLQRAKRNLYNRDQLNGSSTFFRSQSVLSDKEYSSTEKRTNRRVDAFDKHMVYMNDSAQPRRVMRTGCNSPETIRTRGLSQIRFNSTSRDVPATLSEADEAIRVQNVANTTKNCLLHLLEKYNSRNIRNLNGRHSGISIGMGITDDLEHRSVNSLNAFFKRQQHSGNNVRRIQTRLQSMHK